MANQQRPCIKRPRARHDGGTKLASNDRRTYNGAIFAAPRRHGAQFVLLEYSQIHLLEKAEERHRLLGAVHHIGFSLGVANDCLLIRTRIDYVQDETRPNIIRPKRREAGICQ